TDTSGNASSAPRSLRAPREAHSGSSVALIAMDVVGSTWVAGLVAATPLTITRPEALRSRPRSRLSQILRRTSSASSRIRLAAISGSRSSGGIQRGQSAGEQFVRGVQRLHLVVVDGAVPAFWRAVGSRGVSARGVGQRVVE